ncbi:monovalent cation/H(+) antiporter subunit G [Desulfonatronovibrio magnus]|uniref:monovalent cation/H(+) antiporter subunit G n=1 Tax=Desulfonatronovibrio magnus TaxID=698827 RepID=UPI0005EB57E3|nr:monovalent cation/H(+) antiporter subunit G [Desulfonatronovibrio magnus]
METFFYILAIIFISAGVFFMLVGSIGLNRFPDVYCRAHASGKVDTLGIMFFILGLMFFEGFGQTSLKLLLVAVFVAITSPVATHALSRRALLHGVKPWKKKN